MSRNSTPEFSSAPEADVDLQGDGIEDAQAPLRLNEQELADAAEADALGNEATEATEAPAEDKSAETLAAFISAADAVAAEADENGHLTPDQLSPAVIAYRAIEGGIKVKNQGKEHVSSSMKSALLSGPDGFAKASAWNLIQDAILSAPGKAAGGDKEPVAPVNPAKVYAERVATFRTAFALVAAEPVEGYEEFLPDENALAAEAKSYLDWATSTADDKGDAPEISPVALAAAKLSLGKPAKVRKARGESVGTGAVYTLSLIHI